MTDRILNWGLLSTARINRDVIPALRSSKRNRLLAVASRSGEKAQAYAREWKIERPLDSYEALLEDPQIDVIYNSLPNHLHAQWSIKALRAGKHVLCEKPLALTLDEVDAMEAAAKESGKVLAEAFMYRHHPVTLKAKEIADSGQLGRLQLIRGAFTYTLRREGDIRSKKETGGGSIWDVGCYPISYARMLTRTDPVEVFGWQVMGAAEADNRFVGQMKYAGGIYGQFDSSFFSPSRSFMEIVGSDGVLLVPNPFKPKPVDEIQVTRGGKTERIEIRGGELYIGEVEDMADAVLLGKPPRISLAESRGTVAAILGLIRSAVEGKTVEVSDQ